MKPRTSQRTLLLLTISLLACVSLFVFLRMRDHASTAQASSAFSDYRTQSPGRVHRITLQDLPKPFATSSADTPSGSIDRPADAWPKAPEGFSVQLYAKGLDNPRLLRAAPNGDVFLSESSPGRIKVLRGIDGKGGAKQ